MAERAQITVTGVVQGVGFRPYVHSLATRLALTGFVTNTPDGVLIEIEGTAVSDFIRRLPAEAPPLSRITDMSVIPLPLQGTPDFTIAASRDRAGSGAFTHISPDISICSDCLRELADPSDRRFRYPFINCTNCGPRYTITCAVPYDRPNTTMASFAMCPACAREYHDPRDRRFHAQPTACPECGPRCELIVQSAKCKVTTQDPIDAAIEVLQQGGIVAIKGLGGFHIACDAVNDAAVRSLRERKRKSNKPFAVMAASTEALRSFCEVTAGEEALLTSPKRPIVLLRKRRAGAATVALSAAVSPDNQYIGCMLPYAPLHALLFNGRGTGPPSPSVLVMTSGNLSEEPIVHRNEDAVSRLSGLVDAFLLHDRDIFMRVDDSVIRAQSSGGTVQGAKRGDSPNAELGTSNTALLFIRRARGYAPEAIPLRGSGPEVLGCGADLKNTFTLTKGSFAVPSQHIGDMENLETLRFFEESLANLKQVYRVEPIALVHDLHPGYLSTRWAVEQGARAMAQGSGRSLPTFAVQHHYAHIGSVMAEQGLTDRVIGVAFDGTGYGSDGNLWGGEFLLAGIEGFERAGQLRYVPLPGGEAAIREPWRTAVSYLADAAGDRAEGRLDAIGFPDRFGRRQIEQVLKLSRPNDLSPLSSGAGRLFDAVSALLGVCGRNTFEGEAAMALESLTSGGIDDEYPVVFEQANGYTVLDFRGTVNALIEDLLKKAPRTDMATRFHNTVASAIRTVVNELRRRTGIPVVVLSGGTFQNRYLLARTMALLDADGMQVRTNERMPPNDACISLGQAYLVRERLRTREGRGGESGA